MELTPMKAIGRTPKRRTRTVDTRPRNALEGSDKVSRELDGPKVEGRRHQ